MRRFALFLSFAFSALVCRAGQPIEPAPHAHQYAGGFATVFRLGMDLERMMDKDYRGQFPPNPVFMDLALLPAARPSVIPSGNGSVNGVMLTAGFIDLANNIAHAHAINRSQPGFLDQYLAVLCRDQPDKELDRLPDLGNDAYWAQTICNEQRSDFNQIVGMVVAINLAHIYLGQYAKYAGQLHGADGKPVPIARVLTHHEWLKAMRTATKNALDAGLGMSGYIALCEAIDHMPVRPDWTEYFMPRDMSSSKIRSELRIIEAKFFSGRTVD